ncbi:zinc finger MYND domain protein [Wolffia australiana]
MDVHLKELFCKFEHQFGTGPGLGPTHGTCLLKVDGASPAFIVSLYRAAAALFRSDPWKRLRPCHVIGVRVGKDSDWPAAQFLGGDGGDLAVHLLRPNGDLLRLVFLPEPVLSPATKKMIRSLALEPSDSRSRLFPAVDLAPPAAPFRNPSLEDLRHLFAFLRAAALLHPLLRAPGGRPFIETVDVDWPAELAPRWAPHAAVAVTLSHPPAAAADDRRPAAQSCAFCAADAPPDSALPCSGCAAVVYCAAACQRQHWKQAHRAVCGLYKSMMDKEEELAMDALFLFPCDAPDPCLWLDSLGLHHKGMWRRLCGCSAARRPNGDRDPWGSAGPPDEPAPGAGLVLLTGWAEYYNLRGLPMASPAAAILSHPLTVYHAVTAVAVGCKRRLAKGKEVAVHYLGPEAELDWVPAWAEIGHLLAGSGGRVVVYMAGGAGGAVEMAGGRVRVEFVGAEKELPRADAAVALNCGGEEEGEWWGEAVERVRAAGVAALVVTGRSEMACAAAKQAVRAAGLHITHPVAPNPFRSPVRDRPSAHALPSFSNGFIFCAGA